MCILNSSRKFRSVSPRKEGSASPKPRKKKSLSQAKLPAKNNSFNARELSFRAEPKVKKIQDQDQRLQELAE